MEGFASLNTGVFILMFLITFLQNTEAHCNETEAPTFGQNCSFLCHCMDNQQCDFTTGNCSNGCDFDWVGPACQRKNIIRTLDINNNDYAVTRHSSNIRNNGQYAKLAIDRNITSCSYTNYANESRSKPWWRVWLEGRHAIRNILIVTLESATENLKSFTVTIGNVSYNNRWNGIFDNSTVCYTHTSTSPETKTMHVTCSNDVIGNQVKIELASKNTQLVLCDVRLYGECQDGTFGDTCTERCSPHCKDVCDKTNGTCTACESRWTGSRCDQCPDYTYGPQCKYNCSDYCKNNTACSKTSGYCTDGCEPGWGGNYCKKDIVKNVDEQTHRRQAYIAAAATVAVCVLVMAVVTIVLCWKKNALDGRVCPKFGKRGESFFDNAVYKNTLEKRDAYSHETLDMQLEYFGINTKISETDACGTDQVGNFYETLKGNTDVDRTYEKYEDLTG